MHLDPWGRGGGRPDVYSGISMPSWSDATMMWVPVILGPFGNSLGGVVSTGCGIGSGRTARDCCPRRPKWKDHPRERRLQLALVHAAGERPGANAPNAAGKRPGADAPSVGGLHGEHRFGAKAAPVYPALCCILTQVWIVLPFRDQSRQGWWSYAGPGP